MSIARWNELVEASRTAATRLGSVGVFKGLTRLRKLSDLQCISGGLECRYETTFGTLPETSTRGS